MSHEFSVPDPKHVQADRHKQKETKNGKHKRLFAKNELYFFGTGDLGRNTGKVARQVHLTLHYFAEIV